MSDVIYGDFEWDEGKERDHLRTHGISFTEATTVFGDPFGVINRSRKHALGETRYVIIGMSNRNHLLLVAYTVRGRTRIISARKVEPRERRAYEEKAEGKF